MTFAQIPGHEEVKRNLIKSVQQDRIPHAQLLLGSNGCGHLPLALAYISYIMCLNRQEDDSCGVCAACLKTHKYIHPDVHWTMPVIGKKDKLRKEVTSNDFLKEWRAMLGEQPYATMTHWMSILNSENKQADINVKECFQIIQKLGLKSFESDYKIQLIWMPEYLGKEGNRLLKLIEEPTDNTIILLVAQDQQQILNTILSRCQMTYVHGLAPADISQYLVDHRSMEKEEALRLARMADGSLYRALSMLDTEAIDYAELLLQWLRTAYKADPVALRSWVDDLSGWSKSQQRFFYEYSIMFFREYRLYLITGQHSDKLAASEHATLDQMKVIIDLDKAESLSNILGDAIDALSRNLNMRIQLMSHSLEISAVLRSGEKVVTLYRI